VYDEPRAGGAETAGGCAWYPSALRGRPRRRRRSDESVVRAAGRRGAGALPAAVRLV